MANVLVCRTCGGRRVAELAANELELANVGMLERRCARCGTDTAWGLAQDYRRDDRRHRERRGSTERRQQNRRTRHRRGG